MTDGATAATMVVRRPIRRGGQQPPALVPANFSVVNAYIESIDLPSVGISHGVLSTMDVMVNRVEEVLTQMQAAGC